MGVEPTLKDTRGDVALLSAQISTSLLTLCPPESPHDGHTFGHADGRVTGGAQ